jgi:hypothetical protein
LQAIVVAIALLASSRLARAGDPYLEWFTIRTPHFRIHYHSGLDQVAQRIAGIAERAHSTLSQQLGWATSLTDVVISDDSDSANGLAYAIPYNTIRLFVSAPDDMSSLNDFDDWQVELVSHEYTHILHIDNMSGVPAIVNAILGRSVAPNQAQPRWILEGLAVAMESAHTTAGRTKSTLFDMYLRTDVLSGNLAQLDEISQSPRRWPGGDLWYLYGSKFIEWILETYGPDTYARVASEYGSFIVPWGINRAVRRATGRTYPELYSGWKATLEERYRAQERAIILRGLREGIRFTNTGRIASSPHFFPRSCRATGSDEIAFYRDDGVERSGVYRARIDGSEAPQLLSRATGGTLAVAPDCAIYFDSFAPSRRRYFFSDLFRLPPNVKSEDGQDPRRERLTTGMRARDPDVSPDGLKVAYVTNAAGTTTLRIADLDAEGHLSNSRRVVPSARYEQVYTPRFSPDGRRIAYSAWTTGGYRDIRVVDVETGSFIELMHDRAIDQQPAWSPDGKQLYFVSDRGGVSNVYVHDFESGKLSQVTNVVSGAYMPTIAPDGKTLVYVGYTSQGFDLYRMPIEKARFLEPLPPPTRPDGVVSLPPKHYPVSRYNPWPTVRPRAYDLKYGTGSYGRNALTLSTSGSDAVGHHSYLASLIFEPGGPEWRGSLDYVYSRLPFDFRASAFRFVSPQRNYRVGDQPETVTEHAYGVSTGISYWAPSEFDGQSVGLSFNVSDISHDSPLGTRVDPWALVPTEPSSGILTWVHAGYVFTNAEGSLYGISSERGMTLNLGADWAGPAIGSESTLSSFYGSITGYLRMPWRHHHVLALAASTGSSAGTYARRSGFSAGGYADQPLVDVYTSGIRQSLFVLRGFEPQQFIGSNYSLFNAEYRFPIAYVDRGVSTLPVFLRQVSGAVFADWGGAYDRIPRNSPLDVLHLGTGGELWVNFMLGYRLEWTLRLGLAHGFGEAAKSDFSSYFVITSAY